MSHSHSLDFLHSFNWQERIRNKVILDSGCGDGFVADLFSKNKAKSVYAYDIELRDNPIYKSITTRKPALNRAYDVVWTSHVIEHVEHPMFYLKELKVYLKAAGELWLSCPNMADGCVYSPGHLHNFVVPNLVNHLMHTGYDTKNMSWWHHKGQLRIIIKATGTSTWPEPCQMNLDKNGRINPKNLPIQWNWPKN